MFVSLPTGAANSLLAFTGKFQQATREEWINRSFPLLILFNHSITAAVKIMRLSMSNTPVRGRVGDIKGFDII